MKKVTGIGGFFFKSTDPEQLYAWYEEHLGMKRDSAAGCVVFKWREPENPAKSGLTAWSIFPKDSKYFDPSSSNFMINFRVSDLDGLLERLRAEGVAIDPKREDYDYGRFAWIMDPEGNRIELWEPPEETAGARTKPTATRRKRKAGLRSQKAKPKSRKG